MNKHEMWEAVNQKIGILRVLNVRQEWEEVRCMDSTIGDGEHGQRTAERFLVGSDIEHMTEAVLKGICQTIGGWRRIPGRGYILSKSLEV